MIAAIIIDLFIGPPQRVERDIKLGNELSNLSFQLHDPRRVAQDGDLDDCISTGKSGLKFT
jgi:hypothetical protein